eukprot:1924763-Prymnesium_polylepis.1
MDCLPLRWNIPKPFPIDNGVSSGIRLDSTRLDSYLHSLAWSTRPYMYLTRTRTGITKTTKKLPLREDRQIVYFM